VVEVLRGADRFISGRGLSLNDDVNKLLIGNSLNSDSPEHEQRRSVTAVPIMPKNIAPLEDYIHTTAENLAEALVVKERFDAISDFAVVLPLAIVVDLVGLSDEGKDEMLNWASAAFNLFEGFNQRSRDAFADLQGLQMMRDYINPSLDTTVSVAGFAAYYFAKHPDQWDLLRAQPDLVPNAVEEIVRLATPIRAFSRYVAKDTEIQGVPVPQGSRVIAVYASANRDETQFENPDQFDVTRNLRKHLGFGHGKHTCMGLHLARRELINLIHAMRTRVASWHIDGEPDVAMNNTIRAFAHLPVRVVAA